VKLDKTYAREDIDLTRSLRRNAAAAAAAAIKDGNIITQLSVHHIYDLLRRMDNFFVFFIVTKDMLVYT
jgi:hypothetical protein